MAAEATWCTWTGAQGHLRSVLPSSAFRLSLPISEALRARPALLCHDTCPRPALLGLSSRRARLLWGARPRCPCQCSVLQIRSRVDVVRHVVRNGLLWDDLYIGFQTRLRRDPDVYHHLFWNHFQIKLPLTPPNWRAFLMHCG